ncbi:MAG: monosaccharide transporter substrate-binding protein family [Conexibacter sp.]|jgi:ribose transport system substrate-binding protein|nr:monosaccharide transporter substrate-binding protein family [Conexibacter sp.]
MEHGMRRGREGLLLAVLVLAVTIFAVGCGDSSTSGKADDATAASDSGAKISPEVQKAIDEFSSPVTWVGPTDPVTAPKGKRITIIICGAQGATCVRVGKGAEAAAKALGWQATVVDGHSTPDGWNEAIRNAVSNKTDGIVLVAVPPGLVQGAMTAAKKAKIPVSATLSVLGPPTDAKVAYDSSLVGRANAAWMVQDSGGHVKALNLREDAFQDTIPAFDRSKELLPTYCKGCEVAKEIKFTFATASNTVAGDVAQALQSNPEINYIHIPFDAITPLVDQGIKQAGRKGKVKIVGTGAEAVSVKSLRTGDMGQSLCTPAEWMGWQGVDALVRIFAGKQPPPYTDKAEDGKSPFQSNYPVQMRYVTKDNAPPEGQACDGGFDFASKFKELWGV